MLGFEKAHAKVRKRKLPRRKSTTTTGSREGVKEKYCKGKGWGELSARFSGVGCRVWSWGQVEVDESSVIFKRDGVSDEEHQ